jgi:hypothetical protein
MKKWLWFGTLGLLIISLATISKTLAVFETNGSGVATTSVSKWIIKLNNVDISQGSTNSFIIDNVTYSNSANVENGYIAPGRSGYFDIVLDPSGTNVAVRYDIEIDTTSGNYPSNITFTVDNLNSSQVVKTGNNTFSGVVSLADISQNKTITLRLNLNWVDNTENDVSDTEKGVVQNNRILIPINVKVSQYLGEEIK